MLRHCLYRVKSFCYAGGKLAFKLKCNFTLPGRKAGEFCFRINLEVMIKYEHLTFAVKLLTSLPKGEAHKINFVLPMV